jgi:hypothetical protein
MTISLFAPRGKGNAMLCSCCGSAQYVPRTCFSLRRILLSTAHSLVMPSIRVRWKSGCWYPPPMYRLAFSGLPAIKSRPCSWLRSIAVRVGGRRMVEHAQAVRGGVLTLEVSEQNQAARGFCERLGFVVERRLWTVQPQSTLRCCARLGWELP